MDFNLTEEQSLLKDSLTRFLRQQYNFETRRRVLAGGQGWRPGIWKAMADDLGILGASVPTSAGGFGGGPVETMVIMEALGEALVLEPFLETAVIGTGFLKRFNTDNTNRLLSGIVSGNVRTAFAWTEPGSRSVPNNVSTRATRTGDGWVLNGMKNVVTGLPLATHILVTARVSGEPLDRSGISLFLMENTPSAFKVQPYRTIDDHQAGDIIFEGTHLPADALLGNPGEALPLVEQVIDEAAAANCAEAVGAMNRLLADTVDYARQRQQFGVPISSFQVLQHRMVDMYMALEQAISAVYLATLKLEECPAVRARAVSAAKATIGETGCLIRQDAVQIHGAMGMTEELPVGHYFKRLTAIENQFGTTDHHVARYAALMRKAAD